jgi:hypothetical protein
VSYYFEAFDEKWKGGEDKPDGIAKKTGEYFAQTAHQNGSRGILQ